MICAGIHVTTLAGDEWRHCEACAMEPVVTPDPQLHIPVTLPRIPERFHLVCRDCGDHQQVACLVAGGVYTLACAACNVWEIL